MSPNPIILQAAIAIPITIALVVYTLVRRDRARLHLLLAALLTAVALWLSGMVLKLTAGPEWLKLAGLDLELITIIFMSPLFLITMAHFARSALFEDSHAPAIGLFVVSSVFLLGYLTDSHHHYFFSDKDSALAGEHPRTWAGPIFWAVQIWSNLCSLGALGYCALVLIKGRTPTERGRAAMVFAAVVLPVLAGVVNLLGWLPIDYSLAPGTLAITAVFFVQGVHRYGLLGGQTLVRHDLIEHLDAGLILSDQQGMVLDANASAESVIGTTRENMRGLPLPEVLARLAPNEDAGRIGERILQLPLDGPRVDAELVTDDDRVIEISGGAVAAWGSQPAGRFVSLQDRTVQRRNERSLRERQKLESVGILAAGVAHEVNNPLAYVRSNLVYLRALSETLPKHLAPGDTADFEEMPEVIDESIEGLDRIARIVESMLRFSRTSDGEMRPVDMTGVVDEALRLAALQRDTNVRIERLGGKVPLVLGNPERLVQVLLNLLLNAKQALASRHDGVIQAETTTEGDHIIVHVRDDGPGISADLQQRIFDPFFTTRSPDEGTGLGLSIAFDIVREHGGTLELSSKVGAGSCFTVRLAAAPTEALPG